MFISIFWRLSPACIGKNSENPNFILHSQTASSLFDSPPSSTMTLAQAAVWNGPPGSQPASWTSAAAAANAAPAPEANNPWNKTASSAPSFWGDVVKAPTSGPPASAASKVGSAASKAAAAQPKGSSPPKQVRAGTRWDKKGVIRLGEGGK